MGSTFPPLEMEGDEEKRGRGSFEPRRKGQGQRILGGKGEKENNPSPLEKGDPLIYSQTGGGERGGGGPLFPFSITS